MSNNTRSLQALRLLTGLMVAGLVACAAPAPAPEAVPAPTPVPAPAPAPPPPPVPVAAPADWSASMQTIFDGLTARLVPSGVSVEKTAELSLLVTVPSEMSFASGRTAVRPALASVLQSVAEAMAAHPGASALVLGHTDNVGSEDLNNRLSLRRAESVRERLVRAGIDEQRIATQGFGSSAPRADNATADGRAQNRRVEIVITE